MDNHSSYELGMNLQQTDNYEFAELDNVESIDAHGFIYANNRPVNLSNEFKQYEELGGENNWTNDSIECKQEIDPPGFMNNINESSNNDSENDFNEPYQYEYNQVTPLYTADTSSSKTSASAHALHRNNSANQHRMGPYHISSTKNQLPSWYNPPSTSYAQPSGFLQQPYPFYQGGFMGTKTAPVDHSMQHMIHMTSR